MSDRIEHLRLSHDKRWHRCFSGTGQALGGMLSYARNHSDKNASSQYRNKNYLSPILGTAFFCRSPPL